MFSKWCLAGIAGLLLITGSVACSRKMAAVAASENEKPGGVTIALQQRNFYAFNNGSVVFSNRFASARTGAVTQQNDSSFTITVPPENTPVNPSPWYAFKVWAAQPRTVHITLDYGKEQHRYDPKTSYDGVHWQEGLPVHFNHDTTRAYFTLAVAADTLTVAAQELIPAAAVWRWADSLAALHLVQQQIVGKSLMGKPLMALTTGGSNGKKLVVVLSRQHPPEVTGYMAMQEFVQTVVGNSVPAQRFRAQYELVVMPLLNPDGVDEGNWRHSAAGVDLNRDWEFFKQPETRAAKDFLLQTVQKQQAIVYFGIDFHSTYKDVFYTNADTLTHLPGFTGRWLSAFEKAIPGFKAHVKPSGNGGNVSKSWMMRALGCDALTYEVGDDTPREALKRKGRVAAEQMMKLLLAAE